MMPAPQVAPPGTLLLESWALPLLLLHGVLGLTAAFASTHHAVFAVLLARGQKRFAQVARFGRIAPLAVGLQLLVGMALYPTYRVRIRAAHFDPHAPLLSQLFDFKEHLAALSLALLLSAVLLGRSLVRAQGTPIPASHLRTLAALSCAAAALVWGAALLGLFVTARHPVGMP